MMREVSDTTNERKYGSHRFIAANLLLMTDSFGLILAQISSPCLCRRSKRVYF